MIKQPFAGLIASGEKTIETRTWRTKYRGEILICASAQPHKGIVICPPENDPVAAAAAIRSRNDLAQFGVALCIADLYMVEPFQPAHCMLARCLWYENAFSWRLRNVRKIETPFPVKGKLGIFGLNVPGSYIHLLKA